MRGNLSEVVVRLQWLDSIDESILDNFLPFVLVEEIEIVSNETVSKKESFHDYYLNKIGVIIIYKFMLLQEKYKLQIKLI